MRQSTTLRPFFTFFGGKYRAAKHYPTPTRDRIVEPFAGAAGYSLRYYDRKVRINDADPVIAGTWDYLVRVSEEEILRLPLYDGTWETTEDLPLPQEARWLIGWWLNKGTTAPGKRPSAWVRNTAPEDIGENYWGPGIRSRIARQLQHIRHWEVSCGSYEDMPDEDATWFIDPPYEVAGSYVYRDIDFPFLGDWCRSRSGQVMVCENVGATWLPFVPYREIKATAGRYRSGVSKEALWMPDFDLL